MIRTVAITLIVLLGLIFAWHILAPLFGGATAVTLTGGVWMLIMASVAVFSIAILLLFLLTGLGVILILLFGFVWALVAIFIFPFLFPVLIPLFIILLFISFIRHRQDKKER